MCLLCPSVSPSPPKIFPPWCILQLTPPQNVSYSLPLFGYKPPNLSPVLYRRFSTHPSISFSPATVAVASSYLSTTLPYHLPPPYFHLVHPPSLPNSFPTAQPPLSSSNHPPRHSLNCLAVHLRLAQSSPSPPPPAQPPASQPGTPSHCRKVSV